MIIHELEFDSYGFKSLIERDDDSSSNQDHILADADTAWAALLSSKEFRRWSKEEGITTGTLSLNSSLQELHQKYDIPDEVWEDVVLSLIKQGHCISDKFDRWMEEPIERIELTSLLALNRQLFTKREVPDEMPDISIVDYDDMCFIVKKRHAGYFNYKTTLYREIGTNGERHTEGQETKYLALAFDPDTHEIYPLRRLRKLQKAEV